jgi:hypothetical protein
MCVSAAFTVTRQQFKNRFMTKIMWLRIYLKR